MSSKAGNSAKFGRAKRTPCGKAYHALQRWVTNKAKRIKRHNRLTAKAAIRKIERQNALSRDYGKLTALRHIVSQNMTG